MPYSPVKSKLCHIPCFTVTLWIHFPGTSIVFVQSGSPPEKAITALHQLFQMAHKGVSETVHQPQDNNSCQTRRVLKSLKWQLQRNPADEFSSKKFGAAQPGNFIVEDEDYQGFQSSIYKSGYFLNPLTSAFSSTWSFAPGLLHQDSEWWSKITRDTAEERKNHLTVIAVGFGCWRGDLLFLNRPLSCQ